jgi:hypothetical protein
MKYLLAAALIAGSLIAGAQSTQRTLNYKTSVNVSPFSLVDIDHGVMVGAEYRFKKNFSVSLDADYIFYSNYYQEAKESKGFNLRPAVRYYFGKRLHEFLQLQTFYKQVNYSMHGWLGKDCVNDVSSYSQLQDYTFKKTVTGVNLMVGDILPLSDKLYFDLGIGLGVRYKRLHIDEENSCVPPQPNNLINRFSDKVTSLSLPFSMKLAYIVD